MPAGLTANHTREYSGRYLQDGGSGFLHLDVDGPHTLGLMSGQVELSTGFVDVFVPLAPAGDLEWEGTQDGWSLPLRVSLDAGAEITLKLSGALEASFTRSWAHFRELSIELVRAPGVDWDPDLADTGTTGANPNGWAHGNLAFAAALDMAGVKVSLDTPTEAVAEGTAGTDIDSFWDDIELHDAMLAAWSRAGTEDWAMWALAAARHEEGRDLAGVMFDGGDHADGRQRQGIAVFSEAWLHFHANHYAAAPSADAAARNRFFTLVHEVGHALNLAHSWQKSLVPADVPDAGPWTDLEDEPGARSWMNYPHWVNDFWSDFGFGFSANELRFLRHAPEHLVKTGGAPFFVGHGMRARGVRRGLEISVHPRGAYEWLEPVRLSVKLRNGGRRGIRLPAMALGVGDGIEVAIGAGDGEMRLLRPYVQPLRRKRGRRLAPQAEQWVDLYIGSEPGSGSLFLEPGKYRVQVVVHLHGKVLAVSPVSSVVIAPPANARLARLAPAFATPEMGRVYRFEGSNTLIRGEVRRALQQVRRAAPEDSLAARHADVVLTNAASRPRRVLDQGRVRVVPADVERARNAQEALLRSEAMVEAAPAYYARLATRWERPSDPVLGSPDARIEHPIRGNLGRLLRTAGSDLLIDVLERIRRNGPF